MQVTKHTSEGTHSGFETQGRRSKQGYQWLHKKGLMSSTNLKKNIISVEEINNSSGLVSCFCPSEGNFNID